MRDTWPSQGVDRKPQAVLGALCYPFCRKYGKHRTGARSSRRLVTVAWTVFECEEDHAFVRCKDVPLADRVPGICTHDLGHTLANCRF